MRETVKPLAENCGRSKCERIRENKENGGAVAAGSKKSTFSERDIV